MKCRIPFVGGVLGFTVRLQETRNILLKRISLLTNTVGIPKIYFSDNLLCQVAGRRNICMTR